MCDFCNGDDKEHELLKNDMVYLYTKSFNDGAMYIYCQPKNSIISSGLSLRHCIMCGRNLTEEENTVEMKPVIHAHAIIDWLGNCKCSNCGNIDLNSTEPYCQHCGANLDESEESGGITHV